jgi:hypothetical protein
MVGDSLYIKVRHPTEDDEEAGEIKGLEFFLSSSNESYFFTKFNIDLI